MSKNKQMKNVHFWTKRLGYKKRQYSDYVFFSLGRRFFFTWSSEHYFQALYFQKQTEEIFNLWPKPGLAPLKKSLYGHCIQQIFF